MAKKKKKLKRYSTETVMKKVLLYFISNPDKEFTYGDLIKHFKKKKVMKEQVVESLEKLSQQGKLRKSNSKLFKLKKGKSSKKPIVGYVDMNKSGNAYVITDQHAKDVFIKYGNLNQAFNGDKVKVEIFAERKSGKLEGKVVEILERNQTEFVGQIHISKQFAFVQPDRSITPVDFFIAPENTMDAKHLDKVVIQLLNWRPKDKSPTGKVVKVLGKPGLNDVEMQAILVENGFPLSFPKEVMQETNKISDKITEAEIAERRDMREVPTFTIDPHDAKDFDDAISMQQLENGNWEIGVHIADVSHYVKPGTALDKEAYKRATSVYLVDRVLPMLPEKISNVICSLRPNEEKCTYSAVFEMDENAKVINEWFGRTVTYSDKRFTYEEAQEIIEGAESEWSEQLALLNDLAYKLRAQKFDNGAISFETAEVKFRFDEEGKPIEVYTKERKDAHLLIEDFMLLANRSVAGFIQKQKAKTGKDIPYVYRVHDLPDIEKLVTFQHYASTFGHEIQLDNMDEFSKSLNSMMKKIAGKPEQSLLSFLAVRSMSKAKYTTTNIGHYGLGFENYTHFTSPIRRYPDVLAHRLLESVLKKQPIAKRNALQMQLEHSSLMERKAIKAERTATKFKQVEFLQDKIGQEFEGMISGVKHYGIFVELLESKCEGLVGIEDLPYDQYVYKEAKQAIVGLLSDRTFKLGDVVRVKVEKTNLENRTIDMVMAESHDEEE